jgi:hypothetical protein
MKRVTGFGSLTLGFAMFGQALVGGCGGDDDGPHAGGNGAKASGGSGGTKQGSGGTKASGGSNATGGSGNAAGRASTGGSGGSSARGGSGGSGASGGSGGNGGSAGSTLMPKTTISFTASGVPLEQIALSVIGPVDGEYEGMGQHSGESVVLGLKIKLTGISLGQKPPGNIDNVTVTVFDWSQNPKELAIENGFSGSISESVSLDIPDGDYSVVQVNYLSQYDLKAYAYLDTDKNGEVDTTLYTTATGVKSSNAVEAPEDLGELDYTHYGFTYSHNADSATASTTTSFDFTLLPVPARIGDPPSANDVAFEVLGGQAGALGQAGESQGGQAGEMGQGGAFPEGGIGGTGAPPSRDIAITLFIDSYRVVKAWDGAAPSGPSDHIDVIFPQGAGEMRSNQYGVDLVELYPLGAPTFGLEYLPTFAFPNSEAEGYHSESYLIAPSEPFMVENSQPTSIVFDADGVPVIGRTGGNVDSASLALGQAARMFEPIGASGGVPLYRYYVEYGIKNADGVDDGGMYYHNDRSMAGHVVEGFRHLALGDTAPVVVKDGPRCNAEYDRCLGDRGAVIRRVR